MYKFCFEGKLGAFKKVFGEEFVGGVCHVDELGYLFG